MKKIYFLLASILVSSNIYAAAYKIPEQSTKSLALGAAYIAGANSADSAYFNPANMSFLEDESRVEFALTAIYLSKIKYEGDQIVSTSPIQTIKADNKTKSEAFLVPHLHWISKKYDRFRFGFSLTTPAGLSKRWEKSPQTWSAKEFTLRVAEFNPVFSYLLSEQLSFGGGFRVIFTDGKIKLNPPVNSTTSLDYDLDGDIRTRYGYNVALSYKIDDSLITSITYRSKVTLKEKGDAIIKTFVNQNLVNSIKTTGKVSIPLPAALNLAVALDINEKAKFEIVYEKTYWSSYKNLDIIFDNASSYDIHKEKNWKDANTFRVGLTYKNSDRLETMYAIAYDETPIPSNTLGYELPDSDAMIFSLGAIYKIEKDLSFGIAYLYDYKFDRTINLTDQNINGIVGTFKDGGAHLLNISLNYRY